MTKVRPRLVLVWAAVALTAGPAHGQLLGGGLPAGVGGLPASVTGTLQDAARDVERRSGRLSERAVRAAEGGERLLPLPHRAWAEALLRRHPEAVERGEAGEPVVRGEVLALGPTAETLATATRAGFRLGGETRLGALDVTVVRLSPPRGVSAAEAIRRLRALDPAGAYELNHLYQESGQAASAPAAPVARRADGSAAVRVGSCSAPSRPAGRGPRPMRPQSPR